MSDDKKVATMPQINQMQMQAQALKMQIDRIIDT